MTQPPLGGPPPQFPPPSGYGGYLPPAFGPPPPPPQPPRTPNLLPWLIVAGAVLVSGLGLLLVVLVTGDDGAERRAAASSTSSSATTSSPSPSRENVGGNLPGGARIAEPAEAEGGRFVGSGDVAFAWVQAMADGDFQTAYDLSCAEIQDSSTAAAAGQDPAWTLATYFFEVTLDGEGFSGGTYDGVEYSEDSGSDVASFTLQLDSGESFLLLVYVDADGAVCDFI